jgi:hypothetical protein
MAKRKKAETKDPYFGPREEQALIEYIRTDSVELRHKLYNNILHDPFRTMIESILRRYPIHIGNYDITEVEHNAWSHLIEKMVGFKENSYNKAGVKNKAFSYCQTIIRNFYKDWGKKTFNERVTNLPFEDFHEEVETNAEYTYEMDSSDDYDLKEKLINMIIDKIRLKIDTDKSLKKNEVITGEAIIKVLANWHLLFMEETEVGVYNKKISNNFAKNKILFYLKEQTNLSTKEIRSSMKQFKELYFLHKNDFLEDEC